MRYFFEIAYKGTAYHGWQRQNNVMTIQQVVEERISTILGSKCSIMGSGRTDAGVHCKQQFFHADFDCSLPNDFIYHVNKFLPPDIVIKKIKIVSKQAHARFNALSRKYEYCITRKKNPFMLDSAYFFEQPLDVDKMNKASNILLGRKDFMSFSKIKTQVNNFFCEIIEARWVVQDDLIVFHIKANRFLRGMVRAIVGTLLKVGVGIIEPNAIESIIIAKDRRKAGESVPAHGLFLVEVDYPNHTL